MKDWRRNNTAKHTPGRLALGLGMCLCSSVLSAETGHQQLESAVVEFVEGFFSADELHAPAAQDAEDRQRRVEIDISSIDPRLTLSACEEPLIASMGHTQRPVGRINVKVECQGAAPWAKYVPVTIKIYEKVLVTTRPIARGETLAASDLSLAEAEVSTLRYSYLQSPHLAIGLEAKRSLPANTTLVQEALVAPTLVNRGDTVVLSAKAGTVEIRQQGVAMQSGELGKRINVRNTNSDQVVQAVVTGRGEARVGF